MTVVEREVVAPVVTEREGRARVLEAAALEMEVRGHAQFASCRSDGAVCLGGAVLFAIGQEIPRGTNWFSDTDWYAITRLMGSGHWSPFSDMTTPDDVTFLLRWRAAEIRDGL